MARDVLQRQGLRQGLFDVTVCTLSVAQGAKELGAATTAARSMDRNLDGLHCKAS